MTLDIYNVVTGKAQEDARSSGLEDARSSGPESGPIPRYNVPGEKPPQAPQVPTGKDPWAHRSKKMRCRTCMFFVPKSPDFSAHPDDADSFGFGRCRRHAPTMQGFPAVYALDWCGDHKLDENKA